MNGLSLVIIFTDIHFGEPQYPNMIPDSKKIEIIKNILKDFNPEKIILAGDCINRLYRVGSEDEYQKRIEFLKLFKNYNTIYICGDHDRRPNKRMSEAFKKLGIKVLPRHSGIWLGKFYVCHGNEVSRYKIMTSKRDFGNLTFSKLMKYLPRLREIILREHNRKCGWLVTGHFHTSGMDTKHKIVVSGTLQRRTWNNTNVKHTYAVIDFSEHKQGWIKLCNYFDFA